MPSGLKIRCVATKGRNAQLFQDQFNNIIKEAEVKLLDTIIASLETEEQQAKERCAVEKQKIFAAIETWRTSFQSSDSSLDIKADEFVKSAKCFADSFYFECAATRASKRVVENTKRAFTEAKRTEQMETEFTVNSQSATWYNMPFDRKFPRSPQFLRQEKQLHCPEKIPRAVVKIDLAPKIGNRKAVEIPAKMSVTSIAPCPHPKNAQGRRSRSKQQRQSKKPNVRFSDSRSPSVSLRQHSKNGRGRRNGVVK